MRRGQMLLGAGDGMPCPAGTAHPDLEARQTVGSKILTV